MALIPDTLELLDKFELEKKASLTPYEFDRQFKSIIAVQRKHIIAKQTHEDNILKRGRKK